MSHQIARLLGLLLCCLFSTYLSGQVNYPYTRYGIGNIQPQDFTIPRSIGISSAYRSDMHINFRNPAANSALSMTAFDFGVNWEGVRLRNNDTIVKMTDGTVSHFAMGFPIIEGRWGASFGLVPYSNVNYSYIRGIEDTVYGPYAELFDGDGTLYQFYIGNGVSFGDFSVGLNVALMFGTLNYRGGVVFDPASGALNIRNFQSLNVRDVTYSLGGQWSKRVTVRDEDIDNENDRTYEFTAGIYGNTKVSMKSFVDDQWQSYSVSSTGGIIVRDTLRFVNNEQGALQLPAQVGIGFGVSFFDQEMYRRSTLGFDFNYTRWSQLSSPLPHEDPITDAWKLSFGGDYIARHPNYNNFTNLLELRMGFYVGKTYYQFRGEHLPQYGMTFGIGLPVKKVRGAFTKFNLLIDIGRTGTRNQDLYEESYVKMTINFTFNDKWFIRRKFD